MPKTDIVHSTDNSARAFFTKTTWILAGFVTYIGEQIKISHAPICGITIDNNWLLNGCDSRDLLLNCLQINKLTNYYTAKGEQNAPDFDSITLAI
jgi:hypothetical protein